MNNKPKMYHPIIMRCTIVDEKEIVCIIIKYRI